MILHTTKSTLKKNISFQFTMAIPNKECSEIAPYVRALCCCSGDSNGGLKKRRTAIIYWPIAIPSAIGSCTSYKHHVHTQEM